MRGRGLPSLEARADTWFLKIDEAEYAILMEELKRTAKGGLA